MRGLIDQHTSAFALPGSSPWIALIIGLRRNAPKVSPDYLLAGHCYQADWLMDIDYRNTFPLRETLKGEGYKFSLPKVARYWSKGEYF